MNVGEEDVMNYIWGLDLSLSSTGIAIYDLEKNSFAHITSIDTTDIRNIKANKGKYLNGLKLFKIQEEMRALKEHYPPQTIVIERGFTRFNTATQVLYRVHGIANVMFHDIAQIYYAPKDIKATIISGDASKDMVRQQILKEIPNLNFKNEDESDAAAIVLTYLKKNQLNT